MRDGAIVPLILLPGCVWEVKAVEERRSPRRRLSPMYTLAVRCPGEYLIGRTEGRLRPLKQGEG